MQIHLRIKYPRTMPEAKRIVSELDLVWLKIARSERGRQRSRNFIRLIQTANGVLAMAQAKIKKEDSEEFNEEVKALIKNWAKKRRLPVR